MFIDLISFLHPATEQVNGSDAGSIDRTVRMRQGLVASVTAAISFYSKTTVHFCEALTHRSLGTGPSIDFAGLVTSQL